MKRKHEIVLDGADMLLLAGVAIASGILVILYFSTIWAWVYLAMNVRRWSRWVWLAITLVAFAGLLWLRLRQHYRSVQAGAVIGPSLAKAKASGGPRTSMISWLLIVSVLLVFFGLFFSASSPSRWRWCVHVLDMRSWTLWAWAGFGAALLAIGSFVVVFARNRNDDEVDRPRLRSRGLDLLLAVVAMSLGMQVFHPVLGSHEDRIRPGAQVRQQYIPVNTGLKYALEEINYLLYLPRDYGTDRKWPLLVFLHGAGEQGDDVEYVRQAELPKLIERGRFFWEHRPNGAAPAQHKPVAVSEQLDATEMMLNRFIILSPQCTLNRVWAPKYVTELIEHVCNSLPVDRDHVYLTGSGRGGSGTWVVASADAGRFAAIVPIGGDGEMRLAKRLKQVPIWAFHGDRDRPRAIKKNHAVVEAINKLGGRAELTVCPGNHGVCELVYQNGKLYEWLLAQRRSPSAAHN